MKELTKGEEQVMQILWKLEVAFVKDIVAEFLEPKPAYNTVSTIVRILEKKEVVGFKAYGRTHQYYPLLSKEDVTKQSTDNLLSNYFGGSVQNMLSYFVKNRDISASELEKIINEIEKNESSTTASDPG